MENVFDILAATKMRVEDHERRLVEDPEYAEGFKIAEEKRIAEEADKLAKRLAGRGIPGKDIAAIISDDLKPTRPLETAKAFAKRKASSLSILVLAGSRGCGKTTAASWLAAQRFTDAAPWAKPLAPVFLDVAQLHRVSRYDERRMHELERASLLVIDDLGMEYVDTKGAWSSMLDGLINARYANQLRTVITTNLTSTQFKAQYGDRITDRIRECGRFIEFNDESLRGK